MVTGFAVVCMQHLFVMLQVNWWMCAGTILSNVGLLMHFMNFRWIFSSKLRLNMDPEVYTQRQ